MANTTGKKFGGRSKGTPNKSTRETKDLLKNVMDEELTKLGGMLEKLEPVERINALAKLLPYILPKSIELKAEVRTTESISPEQREARIAKLKAKINSND
jgi:hypothetical protein